MEVGEELVKPGQLLPPPLYPFNGKLKVENLCVTVNVCWTKSYSFTEMLSRERQCNENWHLIFLTLLKKIEF